MPKARKKRHPAAQKTLRVFCEGAKTEPYYIRGYLSEFRASNRAAVVEIQPTRKNTPVQLVDEAIKLKKSPRSLPNDEFWVVYDRESVAKYSRSKHSEAWQKAQKSGVNIALSNVCFEFWLLLHLKDTSASYSSYDDFYKNSSFSAEVQKICGKPYSKSSAVLFDNLKAGIADARARAQKVNAAGISAAEVSAMPFDINPYTGMPSLLDAIDAFK
ncbi:hypothetical protein NIT7645_02277 [Phaeobacter italicus]|nr:hypothetical protein NIT7645_02277 [Phaeobacter italicus]SFH68467.1 RloB-like protein [Phaeobacter italicus]